MPWRRGRHHLNFPYVRSGIGQTATSRPIGAFAVALLIAALSVVSLGRATTRAADFGPAAAASLQPGSVEDLNAAYPNDPRLRTQVVDPAGGVDTAATDSLPPMQASEPSPAATRPTPAPLRTTEPPVATPIATLGTSCPVTWFCYPRVGLAGPIVPYADCSGGTEVGTSIRSYTCLSDHYLMGHAYTSFGLVRQWIPGDIVYAYGTKYTLSTAITQSACSAPVFPLAPLSLQTSLTSRPCGEVLVVQGR